ncbi:MAG: oligoribonuclease [Bdellovibrionales bacterium]|nr:oligoribonuclease [Bdellovibrionales bacterium]
MSGLEVQKEVIIEAAAIVTDLNLSPLDEYHAVLKQPQEYIDNMDEWNKTHHGASGLIEQVPFGKDPHLVEQELIEFVKKHFGDQKAILAGNSIGQDKLFIDYHFKNLADSIHYRVLDVSSWKIIMKDLYNVSFEKKETHRATDDIKESIGELKHYLSFITVEKHQST